MAEGPDKESRHKLTVEKGIRCNGDIIITPKSLRKEVQKVMHNDVHCNITGTQRRLKLQEKWPGYSQDVENYVKRCPKCAKIIKKTTFGKTKFTHGLKKKKTMG